jgi:hypothetical protein
MLAICPHKRDGKTRKSEFVATAMAVKSKRIKGEWTRVGIGTQEEKKTIALSRTRRAITITMHRYSPSKCSQESQSVFCVIT